jgi:hypothetical protein
MWTTSTTGSETERLRIDSAGIVKINPLTDPAFHSSMAGHPGLLVQHEGVGPVNGLSLAKASTDAATDRINFWRTRGTWASKVALTNGDYMSSVEAWGWTGSAWKDATYIRSVVSGTVTTTVMPSALVFGTSDTAGVTNDRLHIGPAGLVGIGAKADGTAVGALEVQPTTASYAMIVRAHASTPDTLAFFSVTNKTPVVVLGASNLGICMDIAPVKTSVATVQRAFQVYTSTGSLLGWVPIYASAT